MKYLKYVALVLGLVLLAGAVYVGTACPCERIPGVMLTGEVQEQPVTDWGFVNEVGLCQLQVSNGVLPQSLNLNCMSVGGELFVSCSRCADKRWSQTALANDAGNIRISGKAYPVTMKRLTTAADLDKSWQARRKKLEARFGREVDGQRPDHWWSFQLASR